MGLDNLQSGTTNIIAKARGFLGTPLGVSVGTAVIGAGLGGTVIGAARAYKARRKKSYNGKKRRKKASSCRRSRGRHKHRSSPRGKLRYHTHRKRPSGKGIHYTKKGQPYIIMSSGKARFIKKRGARSSKKRKGGRY